MKFISFLCLIGMIVLFSRCANVQPPSGGPKDKKPPRLVNTFPAKRTPNFNGQEISLEFDEDIQIENLRSELVISPYEEDLVYVPRVKRNTLTLKFKKPFTPNTTYMFNFGAAISDLTEKNPARNVIVVFSTGPQIDSLMISGVVTELATGKPAAKAVVMAFKAGDTLDVAKGKPLYMVKTNAEGKYRLQNMRAGSYHLYALLEKDNSNNYEKRDEKVAFTSEPFVLESPENELDFGVIDYDNKEFAFVSINETPPYVDCFFNKGITDYSVQLPGRMAQRIFYVADRTKIRFYNRNYKQDVEELKVTISATDSLGTTIKKDTTITFKGVEEPKFSDLTMQLLPKESDQLADGEVFDLKVMLSKPILKFSPEFIAITNNGKSVNLPADLALNYNSTALTIPGLKASSDLKISIRGKAFTSVEGDTAKTKSFSYRIKNPDDFGMVRGKVETSAPHFIVQLLDERFIVEEELYDTKVFQFDMAKPGMKYIRVVADDNGNKKWDKGSFEKRIQPERVAYFLGELYVKPNWELLDNNIKL